MSKDSSPPKNNIEKIVEGVIHLLNEEKPPSINDLIRGKVEGMRSANLKVFLEKFVNRNQSKRRNKK